MSSYTVVAGDTMADIAAKFQITLTQLEQANPQVTNPEEIEVGQVLNIPNNGPANPSTQPGLTDNQAKALQLHNDGTSINQIPVR